MLRRGLVLGAAASVSIAAVGAAKTQRSEVRTMGPEDVMKDYEIGLNRHRFEAVEPLISKDALFWFNDGSHQGLDAIRVAFNKTFEAFPLERYGFEDLVWLAMDNTAASCAYRFRWTTTINGRPMAGGGRGTNVLRKDGGLWKIVHEHLSAMPPSQLPQASSD